MKSYTLLLLSLLLFSTTYAQFGYEQVLTKDLAPRPYAVATADLDGDGDLDAVATSAENSNVVWFANEDGKGCFGPAQLIADSIAQFQSVLATADFDGDGDIDVLANAQNSREIVWFANVGDGSAWTTNRFPSVANSYRDVKVVDLDLDGDMDIVTSGISFDNFVWHRNEDGEGTFSEALTIAGGNLFLRTFEFVDLDQDGDLDILYAYDDNLAWIEHLDGKGEFTFRVNILEDTDFLFSLDGADIDGDSDIDILARRKVRDDQEVFWLRHIDGTNDFEIAAVIDSRAGLSNPPEITRLRDLDGDGDLDALVGFYNTSEWFENTDGKGTFGPSQFISGNMQATKDIRTADVDADGDLDVLGVGEFGGYVAWFENTDGKGTFGPDRDISNFASFPWSVFGADMDGDGDNDVLYASLANDKVAWFENTDGKGQFARKPKVVTTEADGPVWSYPADLDADGDLDVISLSDRDSTIAWYKNEDGKGTFGEQIVLSRNMPSASEAYAVDLDADNDPDIIAISYFGDKVAWFKNKNGRGNFGIEKTISNVADEVSSLGVGDLDGDGDNDVVFAYKQNLVWHENEDGTDAFSGEKLIADDDFNTRFLHLADVNGDGFLDILAGRDKQIRIYYNLDGQANFSEPSNFPTSSRFATSVNTYDLDRDGDLDIVYSGSNFRTDAGIGWLENLDGLGNFGPFIEIPTADNGTSFVTLVNLDEDEEPDLLYCLEDDDIIAWRPNLFDFPKVIGVCYFDENQNGILDSLERPITNQSLQLDPLKIIAWNDEDGRFIFTTDTGEYTLIHQDHPDWILTSSDSVMVDLDRYGQVDTVNFGLYPTIDTSLLQIDLSAAPTRCGFVVPFWLNIENIGTNYATGMASLILDSTTTLLTVEPMPDTIKGDTLVWMVDSLYPTTSQRVKLKLRMPGVSRIGLPINFLATADLIDTSGQSIFYREFPSEFIIRCAYDPNDKLVEPNRGDEDNFTLFSDTLLYTVRFQNTGTDTAFNVFIEDQLDNNLDWSTLTPIASSHPYEMLLADDGKITFTFPDILLPDSTTNEPESHGFIKFRILPLPDLEERTVVENTAGIFFDFNPPIITNTTINTFVSQFPTSTSTTAAPTPRPSLRAFPNPFQEEVNFVASDLLPNQNYQLQLFDSMGRLLRTYRFPGDGRLQVARAEMSAGLYFYRLVDMDSRDILNSGKVVAW